MLITLERVMLGDGMANLNRIKIAAGLIEEPQHGTPCRDGDNYRRIEMIAIVLQIMLEWMPIIF